MRRVASGLVVAEVALAIVLLVGAGLILAHVQRTALGRSGFSLRQRDDDDDQHSGRSLSRHRWRAQGYYRTRIAALRAFPASKKSDRRRSFR